MERLEQRSWAQIHLNRPGICWITSCEQLSPLAHSFVGLLDRLKGRISIIAVMKPDLYIRLFDLNLRLNRLAQHLRQGWGSQNIIVNNIETLTRDRTKDREGTVVDEMFKMRRNRLGSTLSTQQLGLLPADFPKRLGRHHEAHLALVLAFVEFGLSERRRSGWIRWTVDIWTGNLPG